MHGRTALKSIMARFRMHHEASLKTARLNQLLQPALLLPEHSITLRCRIATTQPVCGRACCLRFVYIGQGWFVEEAERLSAGGLDWVCCCVKNVVVTAWFVYFLRKHLVWTTFSILLLTAAATGLWSIAIFVWTINKFAFLVYTPFSTSDIFQIRLFLIKIKF